MNYEEENRVLYLYRLHMAYEDDDGNEVWQLGSSDQSPVIAPVGYFTRQEALDYVEERNS